MQILEEQVGFFTITMTSPTQQPAAIIFFWESNTPVLLQLSYSHPTLQPPYSHPTTILQPPYSLDLSRAHLFMYLQLKLI
jgi:hypothetical protein